MHRWGWTGVPTQRCTRRQWTWVPPSVRKPPAGAGAHMSSECAGVLAASASDWPGAAGHWWFDQWWRRPMHRWGWTEVPAPGRDRGPGCPARCWLVGSIRRRLQGVVCHWRSNQWGRDEPRFRLKPPAGAGAQHWPAICWRVGSVRRRFAGPLVVRPVVVVASWTSQQASGSRRGRGPASCMGADTQRCWCCCSRSLSLALSLSLSLFAGVSRQEELRMKAGGEARSSEAGRRRRQLREAAAAAVRQRLGSVNPRAAADRWRSGPRV